MESIREIIQKIKVFLIFPPTDFLVIAIIILVGFGGFGLGRLSAIQEEKTAVVITETVQNISQSASVGNVTISSSGEIVASKNGSKYHFPWCSGAQRIVKKNLISFNSTEEARRAGYTPAANCKGLE